MLRKVHAPFLLIFPLRTDIFPSSMAVGGKPISILVVEGRKAVFETLAEIFLEKRWDAVWAPNGSEALKMSEPTAPDVILANPEVEQLDGFQLTGALKANPGTSAIPVIFLSSLRDNASRKRAYECGAVDFLFKPVESVELLTRIERQANLFRLEQQQKRQREDLEMQVSERTLALRKANRKLADLNQRIAAIDRSKSEFLKTISHELRTPANGFFGAMELLLDTAGSEVDPEIVSILQESRERLMDLIDDAVLLVKLRVEGDPVTLPRQELSSLMEKQTREATIRSEVKFEFPTEEFTANVSRELFEIFWIKLLQTADCFSESAQLRMEASVLPEKIQLTLLVPDSTLPPALAENFFDDFAIDETAVPHGRVGLKPTIVHEAVRGMGGEIRLRQNQNGLVFEVQLPCAAEDPGP